MQLQTFWHVFMADAGNEPGAQKGDIIVTLIRPVGGIDEIRIPSSEVSLAAESGNLIGVQLVTADGRHLFVPTINLAGIVDAPVDHKGRKGAGSHAGHDEDQEADGKDDGSAGRPSVPAGKDAGVSPEVAAAHDKAEAAHDKSEAADDKAQAESRDRTAGQGRRAGK